MTRKTKTKQMYPRLAIDWNEEIEPQMELLLSPSLLAGVADLAGLGTDSEKRAELRSGLYQAVDAYSWGALERANQRTETEDNNALERVSKKAQELYDALLDLTEHPGLERQVKDSIRSCPTLFEFENVGNLDQFTGTRQNIFQGYREVLVDLQVCVENVINRKPKPVILEGLEEGDPPTRLDSPEELEEKMRLWREKSAARRLPKDHALHEFLHSLRPVWEAVSDRPFTEGMYHSDQGQTISHLVDAVESVLKQLDPDVTRERIANAVCKVRKSGCKNFPS